MWIGVLSRTVAAMRVDLYASQAHYADHLWPIWSKLPDELRGDSWAGNGTSWWGNRLPSRYRRTDRIMLVGGWSDVQRIPFTPMVYVEHGAGQSYTGEPRAARHSAYSGGRHPAHVIGYLAPSERVALAWRTARPGVPVGVVGCPRLDPWLNGDRGAGDRRTVAVTFHWNCAVAPETRWALPHYRAHLARVVASWRSQGFTVLGHGHPRAWGQLERVWRELGVDPVQSSDEILDRAGILVGDNTSLLYEVAALDRPVVCLNAPWYRRDVEHGLRFWSLVPGVQVDNGDELAALDLAQYADLDPDGRARRITMQQVYAATDGTSGQRAADWLAGLQEGAHDGYGLHGQGQGSTGAGDGAPAGSVPGSAPEAGRDAGRATRGR